MSVTATCVGSCLCCPSCVGVSVTLSLGTIDRWSMASLCDVSVVLHSHRQSRAHGVTIVAPEPACWSTPSNSALCSGRSIPCLMFSFDLSECILCLHCAHVFVNSAVTIPNGVVFAYKFDSLIPTLQSSSAFHNNSNRTIANRYQASVQSGLHSVRKTSSVFPYSQGSMYATNAQHQSSSRRNQ